MVLILRLFRMNEPRSMRCMKSTIRELGSDHRSNAIYKDRDSIRYEWVSIIINILCVSNSFFFISISSLCSIPMKAALPVMAVKKGTDKRSNLMKPPVEVIKRKITILPTS